MVEEDKPYIHYWRPNFPPQRSITWGKLCTAIPIDKATLARRFVGPGIITLKSDPFNDKRVFITGTEITRLRNAARRMGIIGRNLPK